MSKPPWRQAEEPRITRDAMLMQFAIVASHRSTCLRKKVGAVIAIDGRPLVTGYAGSPQGTEHCTEAGCLLGPDGGCIRTQHAEMNAIAFAARKGICLDGAWMYITVSPCLPCAKIIIGAGISRVLYKEKYRDTAPLDYLLDAKVNSVHYAP